MERDSKFLAGLLVLVTGLAVGGTAGATTVVLQPSSQDSYLRHENPNTPSGSGPANTRIRVKSDGSGNPQATWWRGVVQFDLSAIPQFATVSSATLELFEGNTGTQRTYGVHKATGPWLQATVKWNTQPTFVGAATTTNTVGDPPRDWRSFAVTTDVQAWINAPASNYGWVLKDQAEASGSENINFVSMEDSSDVTHRPRLTVTFTAPSCTSNAQCQDTNLCTTNERCEGGVCVVDSVSCNDNNACTDDLCEPNQGCVNTVGECNDGFDCTIDGCNPGSGCFHTVVPSVCTEGGCRTGACIADVNDPTLDPITGCTVTSQQPDGTTCAADSNQCTSDLCASGHCTHPNAPNGASCSDGNGCTQPDTCNGAGTCVPGSPVVCPAPDQCHVAGTCDTQTGLCSNPNAPDGSGCDDGDACTQTDACSNGSCVGSGPVVCTALDQCHVAGTCNTQTGLCSNPNAPNGSGCDDGDACTQTDACSNGSCVGSGPVVCTALDQCHVAGTCNTQTGLCSNPNAPNGSGCDDGDACTQTDACSNGSCVGSGPVVCTALDQCHVAGTCNTQTGLCSNPNAPNGSGCDDGNACTQTDACSNGSCVGGNPVVCTALDQCHLVGTCDTQTGLCPNPDAPDGSGCDDGLICTYDDQCTAGVCGGTSASCGDGILQPACGEQCDPPGADCTPTCQYVCGPPRNDCKLPTVSAKAQFQLKNGTPDSKDRFSWKWIKGAATTLADLGNPTASTDYLLCVYDQSANPQPIMTLHLPAGGTCGVVPCWKALNGKGFKRKNVTPYLPDGDQSSLFKVATAGKGKMQVKGKDVNLPMPTLALSPKVTVQLKNGHGASGTCWSADFSTPLVNTTTQFKAKGD
ncbi:MAG: DNRLRE domain-containing protein [Candidatus Binatia bacterium]